MRRRPAGQTINVTAAQLASSTYQRGSGSDDLWVRANDGTLWGTGPSFTSTRQSIIGPGSDRRRHPREPRPGFTATSLFSVRTPTTTRSRPISSGIRPRILRAGTGWSAARRSRRARRSTCRAAPACEPTFQSGSGSDDLWVRANDGTLWSAWTEFHVTAPIDLGPTVSVANLTASHGQSFAGSSLFSNYSDPFGDPATQYDFWDTGAGGGHFVLNGTALGANQHNIIAAAQLSQLNYQSGSGTDTLWVRANDGTTWGAWSNTFTVTAPLDNAPIVHVSNVALTHGNANPVASTLFSVTDADGDSIATYAFWDNGAGGGQFVLNGVAQPNGREIDVTAAQLPQLSYQAGSGTDTLWVKANDGVEWGNWSSGFTVTAPPDQAPVVTASNLVTTLGAQLSAATLFSVMDADNDTIMQYDLWDTGNGGGHFVLGGNALGANQHNIMTAAQLAQTTYVAGSGADTLWVRANDGAVWGMFSSGFTVTG